jgi:hypothetical protein
VSVLFIASARMASFGGIQSFLSDGRVMERTGPASGSWRGRPSARFVADYARRAWALAEREGRSGEAELIEQMISRTII